MNNVITLSDVAVIMGPLINTPLLTPREANTLTFRIIELLMQSKCDSQCLKLLARYLSKTAYEDLVKERNVNHYCGYPLCNQQSNDIKLNDDKIIIKSLKLSSFYKSSYCSKAHYQCSEFYLAQLSEEALFMRINLDLSWFNAESVETNIKLLDDHLDNVLDKLLDVSI